MSAPVNNRFWQVRLSHGRKPFFDSPEAMWAAACEYFEWVEENPLMAEKLFCSKDGIVRGEYSKMRAMTIEGLCNFVGVTARAYRDYRNREGFLPIMEKIEQVLYDQKFSGAAADLLNANIIARDLGLADRQEHGGKDGGPLKLVISQDDAEL